MGDSHRVVLVVGASSGIGRAVAHALARRGDTLLGTSAEPAAPTAGNVIAPEAFALGEQLVRTGG